MKIADAPPLLAQGSAPAYRATTASPLSFQAESGERRLPLAVRRSLVPPTPVTSGSEAGQSTTGWVRNMPPALVGPVTPKSLAAASTVTWCRSASE